MNYGNQYLRFYLIIRCFVYASFSVNSTICPYDQGTALLQLKQEFTRTMPYPYYSHYNTPYPKMNSWKQGSNCCEWQGVECDAENGQVIGLDLSDGGLLGPLNSSSRLFSLRHLHKLNLARNDFIYSKIPSEFGQLVRLTHLDLSYSSFSGEIPLEITWLPNLVSLRIYGGPVIEEECPLCLRISNLGVFVQNITNLRELDLGFLSISSSVPKVLGNLTTLTSLTLQDCQLHGEFPHGIFLLPNLQTLKVSHNELLTGDIADFIGNLSQLRYLDISYNNFAGQLPSSLGNVSQLNSLNLQGNRFIGQIPPTLGRILNLSDIDLSYNLLSGIIPSSLFRMPSLVSLLLHGNKLTGQIGRAHV